MMIRLFSCALLSLLLVVGTAWAQVAQDQSGAQAQAVADQFLDALEAGQWAAASTIMGRQDVTAEQLEKLWTAYAELGAGGENWRGPMTMVRTGGTEDSPITRVSVALPSANGHAEVRMHVKDGKPFSLELAPSIASFGPYADLAGWSHAEAGGTVVRWYLSRSRAAVVREVRINNGPIADLQVIKPTTPGSLVMLRSHNCPSDVCGQTGSFANGVVTWREPKAIGGRVGDFLEVRMWLEQGMVLATQIINPHPYSGGPAQVMAPYRYKLSLAQPLSEEQYAEAIVKVPALEARVDVDVANALGNQLARRQAQDAAAEEKRRSSERVQSFNRLMGNVSNALAEADTGSYAEAQANLDATVANIQYAAAVERQQQQSTQQASPQPARAPQPPQAQVAAASPPSPPLSPSSVQGESAAVAAPGQPLRFIMSIGMRNLPGDKVNSTCYSNVVTRDGPPGWGGTGFLPAGSGEQARQTVEGLKAQFIAACQAGGRQISSAGNFNWVWNQRPGDEQEFASARAKYSEDVSVSVQ
jgi:hypothetical protein